MKRQVKEVVVIDRSQLDRTILVQLLQRLGCVAVAVDSWSAALSELGSDIANVSAVFVAGRQLPDANLSRVFIGRSGARMVALVEADESLSTAALRADGATATLRKPYDLDALTAVIG